MATTGLSWPSDHLSNEMIIFLIYQQIHLLSMHGVMYSLELFSVLTWTQIPKYSSNEGEGGTNGHELKSRNFDAAMTIKDNKSPCIGQMKTNLVPSLIIFCLNRSLARSRPSHGDRRLPAGPGIAQCWTQTFLCVWPTPGSSQCTLQCYLQWSYRSEPKAVR